MSAVAAPTGTALAFSLPNRRLLLAVLVGSVAFLVATVVADLKDALFTFALIALASPLYFLLIRRGAQVHSIILLEADALD